MTKREDERWGFNQSTHHLLELKEPPAALIALRGELLKHPDILEVASKETTFEGALGTIAEKLDIALDGVYEPVPLFTLLTECLQRRNSYKNQPHLRHPALVNAELIETAGEVELKEMENDISTIAPLQGRDDTPDTVCLKCGADAVSDKEEQNSCCYPDDCGRHSKNICNWPGCVLRIPTHLWGCHEHWDRLPARYRLELDNLRVAGDIEKKTPAYIAANRSIVEWIVRNIILAASPFGVEEGQKLN